MNSKSKNEKGTLTNLLTLAFAVTAFVVLCSNGMAQGVGRPPADRETLAAAQGCNCAATTLMNTQAKVKFASFPANTDWNGAVNGTVEIPSSSITPWTWNNPQRFNIDLQSSKLRIEFARDATYGQPGGKFTFTLNPLAPAGCGNAKIVGYSITTNRTDALPYITANSSFNSANNTVAISFGNSGPNPFADWRKGDWIEAQLKFECQGTPTGDPTASTCCPPVNKPMIQGMFKHQGNAASTYLMPLDTSSTSTTASFVNGLNAYMNYLRFVCPQTSGLKVEFFTGPVAAPTSVGGPAGQLTGSDAISPKSTLTIPPITTVASLNTALGAINNFPHTNGQYYRISVRVTGVNAAGQTVDCGFNAKECAIDDTFGFVFNAGAKMAGSPYTN